MKSKLTVALLFLINGCTTVNVPVTTEFTSKATKMPVKGMNGIMVNQKLTFGPYQTTPVKRGWDFTASVQHTKFSIKPEEALLKVFHIDTDKKSDYQRNSFQYILEKEGQLAEVYATEKFDEKNLVYKSNNPWIGNVSNTKNYKYSFAAAIVPLSLQAKDPWSLVLISAYSRAKDTARKLLDEPYVEEEGYATNGKETIAINPLRLKNVGSGNGTTKKVIGGSLFSGYELRIDNNVVGVIDLLDNNVWIRNDLAEETKFMMATISSAIMLKRIGDAKDHDVNDF
ncbi:MAG TPA: hypothetical protein VM888_11385 [Chitinophagaceae bacterium]|nr:hypothetical protein [Chitinophagaceae bacterium]